MSETLLKILDLARWAPSGDNQQPWRFEIIADDHIAIHGFDTRDWCIYDFQGHASHMAHGALLETLRIAATKFGLHAEWTVRLDLPDTAPIYDVHLRRYPDLAIDPLVDCITRRSVQRRAMRMQRLTATQRRELELAVGDDFRLLFFESFNQRVKIALLLWHSAYLRLTCPEAYQTHRKIIEWGARFSEDRIPEQAVGVDPLTAKLMHWVLQSWDRVVFFNRYLFGTVAPRVQLDVVPAIACGAHVLMVPHVAQAGLSDYLRAGVAMQRLWLTATSLGLHLQPEMTPLIFRWYARAGLTFSSNEGLDFGARALSDQFEGLTGTSAITPYAFFARAGLAPEPKARSLRRPLTDLLKC